MKKSNKQIICFVLSIFTISVFQSCKKNEINTNQFPTCKISSPSDGKEITRGETITIVVDADDTDGNIAEVRFYLDGIEKSSLTDFPFHFKWQTSGETTGNHQITATCIDNSGDSTSHEISVELILPGNADFNADQTTGVIPLTINFTDNSTNNPTAWLWDFGDGNTSKLQNPSHTYSETGTFTVTLITSNSFSGDTISKTDHITASNTGVFTDPRDGQTYEIVNIGGQVWFAENLNFEIANSSWYENDSANGIVYGRLYSWEAALEACPPGWHVPTDDEWKQLEIFLGMSQSEADGTGLRGTDEGIKLKSTEGWISVGNGTNTVGFSALPGGLRNNDGVFERLGSDGYWWTSTESSGNQGWYRRLFYDHNGVTRFDPPPDGSSNTLVLSERVIRD